MICSEIITKDKFEAYLQNIIINKEYLERIMGFFDSIKDIKIHEKIMFLLYNEYISLYDIIYNCYVLSNRNFNLSAVQNIINEHSDKFNLPYSYIKNDFFRNHVTTLTFEYYQSVYNIQQQLSIVYESLSTNEKEFLKRVLDINNDNFIDLVRLQVSDQNLELSKVEQDSTKLNLVSSLINGTKNYSSDKVKNSTNTDETDTMISILNKIDLGTIH